MPSPAASRGSGAARLKERWRARLPYYSRGAWASLIVLDVLPWPWGEDVLAGLSAVVGLMRPSRRRAALGWARAVSPDRPWRLAAEMCAFRGRWAARMRLLGWRDPEALRRHLVVVGEEHLAAPGSAIIVGFHVGPPSGDLPFRVLGYPVTFLGTSDRNAAIGWFDPAWRPFVETGSLSYSGRDRKRWSAMLYAARQTLQSGGKIHIMGDGGGKEAFPLSLPIGTWPVRSGWLALHQLTGAPVLPVFHHLEGRRHVITVHPPLPMLPSDPAMRLQAWRERLTDLMEQYVRRFPEQCPHLAMVGRWTRPSVEGPIGPAAVRKTTAPQRDAGVAR